MHGHGDGHDHCHCDTLLYRKILGIGLAVILIQAYGSYLSNSLALLSDTFHALFDTAGIGLALLTEVAVRNRVHSEQSMRAANARISAVLMGGMAIVIVVEALDRLSVPPSVQSGPMLGFALLGMAGNAYSLYLVARHSHANITSRALIRHIAVDLGQSFAVIAGSIILFWRPQVILTWCAKLGMQKIEMIDPILSLMLAGWALVLTYKTWRESRAG